MIETELKPINIGNISKDVKVIIFDNTTSTILEKPLVQYVVDSVNGYEYNIQKYNPKLSFLGNVKKVITPSLYTLVLFSYTPLLTKDNVQLIIDYIVFKEENYVALPYGAIFKNAYISDKKDIKSVITFSGDNSQFLKIESVEELGYATQVIKHRIISGWIKNGAKILDPNTLNISAYVTLESGTTVYPNNSLKGDTYIGKGVVLKENNVITDSEIGEDCIVAGSVIKDSTISSGCTIYPYNTIDNATFVGKGTTIKSYNKISNARIGDNVAIESFNDIS